MKFIEEYRDPHLIKKLVVRIKEELNGTCNIMEICGGQTHSILKYNLPELLPEEIKFIHGPGCPVCVTPVSKIDYAINISQKKNIILCSYGDMLRVPGTETDLLKAKAVGADIRIVYSPLQAVKLAEQNPDKKVVFFSIGFETTAPANAQSVLFAKKKGLKNYFLLCSNILVPPALELILASPECKIDSVLAAGHVCSISGFQNYYSIVKKYKIPIVVTGFEPADILYAASTALKLKQNKIFTVKNNYKRAVQPEGNKAAQKVIDEVFSITDAEWRGIGLIKKSGYKLAEHFSEFDAETLISYKQKTDAVQSECIAGEVLQGLKYPVDCPAFATDCKPENPIGAPMVSSEGACAAYYKYKNYKF